MRYDVNGNEVDPEYVLDREELADYCASRRNRPRGGRRVLPIDPQTAENEYERQMDDPWGRAS